jgi:DNA-binding response OmpR family regulator
LADFPKQLLQRKGQNMSQPKILIVDDDANSRAVLCDILAGESYQLFEACVGSKVLEIVDRERPDLILLDAKTLEADGNNVIDGLKDRGKNQSIPVILIAASDAANTRLCEAIGKSTVDQISKPFSDALVRARVRSALRSQTPSSKEKPTG